MSLATSSRSRRSQCTLTSPSAPGGGLSEVVLTKRSTGNQPEEVSRLNVLSTQKVRNGPGGHWRSACASRSEPPFPDPVPRGWQQLDHKYSHKTFHSSPSLQMLSSCGVTARELCSALCLYRSREADGWRTRYCRLRYCITNLI